MQLYYDLSKPLFVEALTHSSYIRQFPKSGSHNERLEFLGDAVLQLCVTDLLTTLFPECREGDLTRMRHQLVDTQTLADIARELELGLKIRLSEGEARDGGRDKDKTLANTVEAILGAIYTLDGLDNCHAVIRHHFSHRAEAVRYYIPSKQVLLEWSQRQYGTPPIYELIDQTGPAHQSTFQMGVLVDGEQLGVGFGRSKKESMNQAAVAAVQRLRQEGAI